jgi:hypothetical protein
MSTKKIVIGILIILVLLGGAAAGYFLVQRNQDIEEKASVPGGEATVEVSPATGSFDVGETINAQVYFNTAGIAVSGVVVSLKYQYSGSNPEINVQSVTVAPQIATSPDWSCPTQGFDTDGTNVNIEIGCGNTSAQGFSSTTNTLLATVTLVVNQTPAINPTVLRFDEAESRISRRSDDQDVLLIPTSTGSYSIGGAIQPTAVPTSPTTPSPTTTISLTPTLTPTITTSLSPTVTGVGKGGTELPDSGIGAPTLLGIGIGVLVIAGSVILAL